jgi:hypothetical protein
VLLVREREWRERQKRQVSSSCDVIPFNITFREIGMEDWIEAPLSFEAGFCSGTCKGVRSYYEFLMTQVFLHNQTMEEQYGRCWETCCKPREYEYLTILHAENDNTFALRNMTNMVVKSCACI